LRAARRFVSSAHRASGAPLGRLLQGMPPLKRAPSGSPARAGPRESLGDSPAKATPPPAQRFCLEDGITGTGLGFNALLATADSAANPGQRSPPHPANVSAAPAARLYPYSWRERDKMKVMHMAITRAGRFISLAETATNVVRVVARCATTDGGKWVGLVSDLQM
jgi:hypothetical protein